MDETPLYRAQVAISAAWIAQRYRLHAPGFAITKAVKALARLSAYESRLIDEWLTEMSRLP